MKVYNYQDRDYNSLRELRNDNPYILFRDNISDSDLNAIGITVKEIADPTPSLEELKTYKEIELEQKSASFENNLNKDMFFTSSIGFKCNGDRRTRSNLEDLITYFDMQAQGEPKTVDYRDYENNVKKLTKEQLQTLLVEHVQNGQALYNQKWQLESQINSAKSIEDLNRININFTMADFSKK